MIVGITLVAMRDAKKNAPRSHKARHQTGTAQKLVDPLLIQNGIYDPVKQSAGPRSVY